MSNQGQSESFRFRRIAESIAQGAGSPVSLGIAIGIILAWLISGPFFHYSDTWQLVINTGTTIVTFLMGFVIQFTQNRDNKVLHLKLDELVSAAPNADNSVINVDDLSNEQLDELHQRILARLGTTPRIEN